MSFGVLFVDRGGLRKSAFYYCKIILSEVWEGLESWWFRCVFRVRFFRRHFLRFVCGFCVLFSAPGLPKGPPGSTLRSHFFAKIQLWFPEGSQGGFRVPKVSILEVIWECFGNRFWMYFWWGLGSGPCYSHEHVSTCSAGVFKYFMWFRYPAWWLFLKYFCNIAHVF